MNAFMRPFAPARGLRFTPDNGHRLGSAVHARTSLQLQVAAAWLRQKLLCFVVCLLTMSMHETGAATLSDWSAFEVTKVNTRLVDGVYLLDAKINFDFSKDTRRAMDSGVPLTIVVDIQVLRERRGLWDAPIAKLQARYRIEKHALSDRYVFRNLNTGDTQTFANRSALVSSLSEAVSSFPMLDEYLLEEGHAYSLWLRARVDIEALPSPLRPLAYLSSLWNSNTQWSAWPIAP